MLLLAISFILFLCLTAGLVWFFSSHDRGPKEPAGALWIAVGFGVLAAIVASIVESWWVGAELGSTDPTMSVPLVTLFGDSLKVGFIEETLKFLPLALFIWGRKYFDEHTDGITYFAMSGLGFAMLENVGYMLAPNGAQVGVLRAFILLFFHPATASITGYYLARAKIQKKGLWAVPLVLATVAVMHGVYDFGLSSNTDLFIVISLMLTVLLNAGLFLYYMHATEEDQRFGLSAVGHNTFCRHCGRPNAHHDLYCEYCGQLA